ncbi:archease [Candidatus Manganitrophus noduliformans]|uniref:Archease n=1 Tax=Candidatus Manganitrophus noduliformans TaxID=2606439 RepID=A0A7X6I9I4_9BACT|nr:archease [Candidatus Manganitrophus noduliformans]NKE69503.1 archease [Candidatus Manganitrophus noduliformans]
MPYRFIEGLTVADIAFEARGKTLEALFSSAGQAVTAAQLHDLRTIRKKESRTFDLTNKAIDMLLFNFLQELIYWKDVDLLLFKSFDLSIRQKADGKYHLIGTGRGEPIDVSRHQPRVDVKAVTMHKFEVASDASGWKATVVLDI